MKKYAFLLVFALFGITSCTYYVVEPKQDGEVFFKLNWVDGEPAYINPGGVVPNHFRWNTYYRTYPGMYLVYYEYELLYRRNMIVVYDYELEVEVWGIAADRHRDGDDVFFELVLFPDGYFDYFHEVVRKSYEETGELPQVEKRTLLHEVEEYKDGYGVRFSYYKLPPRYKEIEE